MILTRASVTRPVAVCLLLTLLFLNAGCGNGDRHPVAKVTGVVTLDGEPLKFGSILFMPDGNFPSAEANIKPDGSFEMGTYTANDGAVYGKHTVIITARVAAGASLPEEAVKGAAGTVSVIPERYGDPSESGLTVDVESGGTDVDFELKTAKEKPIE